MKNICICTIYILLDLAGMTLIKMGGQSKSCVIHLFSFFNISPLTIAGVGLYGISFLIFTFLIAKMQVSLAIPLLSAVVCCGIVIIGVTAFKEVLNIGQVIGLGIIAVGIVIVGVCK